jgi:hypothetical protein
MDLSLRDLEQAVSIRREIDRLQGRLNALMRGGSASTGGDGARRRMSLRTRAKLAAAARARWAKRRGKAGRQSSNSSATRQKGGLTPAGRRKLSQLMKARWAAKRKAAGVKK